MQMQPEQKKGLVFPMEICMNTCRSVVRVHVRCSKYHRIILGVKFESATRGIFWVCCVHPVACAIGKSSRILYSTTILIHSRILNAFLLNKSVTVLNCTMFDTYAPKWTNFEMILHSNISSRESFQVVQKSNIGNGKHFCSLFSTQILLFYIRGINMVLRLFFMLM